MKFNWGTGILLFIILFLLLAALFIGFAMRQDVSLVHEDYYERGVDYTRQMKTEARSKKYQHAIHTKLQDGSLQIEIEKSLAKEMDSGEVLLYRPSNSDLDLHLNFVRPDSLIIIPGDRLITGRYILQLQWLSGGQQYQFKEPLFIR